MHTIARCIDSTGETYSEARAAGRAWLHAQKAKAELRQDAIGTHGRVNIPHKKAELNIRFPTCINISRDRFWARLSISRVTGMTPIHQRSHSHFTKGAYLECSAAVSDRCHACSHRPCMPTKTCLFDSLASSLFMFSQDKTLSLDSRHSCLYTINTLRPGALYHGLLF